MSHLQTFQNSSIDWEPYTQTYEPMEAILIQTTTVWKVDPTVYTLWPKWVKTNLSSASVLVFIDIIEQQTKTIIHLVGEG